MGEKRWSPWSALFQASNGVLHTGDLWIEPLHLLVKPLESALHFPAQPRTRDRPGDKRHDDGARRTTCHRGESPQPGVRIIEARRDPFDPSLWIIVPKVGKCAPNECVMDGGKDSGQKLTDVSYRSATVVGKIV